MSTCVPQADLSLEQLLHISRGSLALVDLSSTSAHTPPLTIPRDIHTKAPSLQHLYLSQSRLQTVPPELSRLRYLQVLDLSANRLKDVEALVSTEQPLMELKKLYLSSNDLRRFVKFLLSLIAPCQSVGCSVAHELDPFLLFAHGLVQKTKINKHTYVCNHLFG